MLQFSPTVLSVRGRKRQKTWNIKKENQFLTKSILLKPLCNCVIHCKYRRLVFSRLMHTPAFITAFSIYFRLKSLDHSIFAYKWEKAIRTKNNSIVCVCVCVNACLCVSACASVRLSVICQVWLPDKEKKSIHSSFAGSSSICPSLSLFHPFSGLFLPHFHHILPSTFTFVWWQGMLPIIIHLNFPKMPYPPLYSWYLCKMYWFSISCEIQYIS